MVNEALFEDLYKFQVVGAKTSPIPNYMFVNRVLSRLEELKEDKVKEYCFPLFQLLRFSKVGLFDFRNFAKREFSTSKKGGTSSKNIRFLESFASAKRKKDRFG